jgi:hypothetical protein
MRTETADNLVERAKNLLFLTDNNEVRFVHKFIKDCHVDEKRKTDPYLRIYRRPSHAALADICRRNIWVDNNCTSLPWLTHV